jgi:hypothetical protein
MFRHVVVACIAFVVGSLLLAIPVSADAGGHDTHVGGSQTSDGGEVVVTGGGGSHGGGSHGGSGSANPVVCTYYAMAPGGGIGAMGEQVSVTVPGTQYWLRCVNTQTGATESLDLVTATPPDPAAVARDLAEQAYARLVLPLPSPRTNPPDGQAIVNIPVWFWVGGWSPRSEAASAAGVTATVTALPFRVRWNTGDGATLTCDGPGTPYDTHLRPEDQHTDCAHTYSAVTGHLIASATTSWHVAYTATNGQSGDLGVVARTTTVPVDVRELVTNIRPG